MEFIKNRLKSNINLELKPVEGEFCSDKDDQDSSCSLDSIVLDTGNRKFFKSTAALRIARYMRFPWPFIYCLIIVPPFIRDRVYDWVARNRHKWNK